MYIPVYHIENSGTCHSYVLCIPYWNSRGKRFLKYIKISWIQGGDTKPWHLQGALSIIIWKYKGWDVSKLGIPWVWDNYQEYPPPKITWNFRGPPQNNRFPRKTEIVYVYQGDEGFWILNRGCTDIKLLIIGQNVKSKTWVDTVAHLRIYRQYSDCKHSLSYFVGNLWLGCLSVTLKAKLVYPSKWVNLGWVVDARLLVTNTISNCILYSPLLRSWSDFLSFFPRSCRWSYGCPLRLYFFCVCITTLWLRKCLRMTVDEDTRSDSLRSRFNNTRRSIELYLLLFYRLHTNSSKFINLAF